MATMSSRLVVMMTPDDKKQLEARAQALAISPSELVRRAAQDYHPTDHEAALELLTEELAAAVSAIQQDLKNALVDLDQHRAAMARMKAHPHECF